MSLEGHPFGIGRVVVVIMYETGSGNVPIHEATSLERGCSAVVPRASAKEQNRLVRVAVRISRKLLVIPISMYRHPGRAASIFVLLLFILSSGGMIAAYLWASYHLRAARSALERYHTSEAIPHLRAALFVWSHDPEALLLSARASRRTDEFDRASHYLDQYQEVRGPDDESLLLERVLVAAESGDVDSVSKYCQGLVKQDHPATPLILEALSRGYLRMYRLHEAEFCIKEWFRHQPDNTQAFLIQAQLYDLQGRQSEAIASYRSALKIDPQMDEARLRLCIGLMQLGSIAEALPQLEYIHQRFPDNFMVQVYLARAYDRQGRSEEAENLLDAILKNQPHFAAALAERGKLALRAGQNEQAEKWLHEAITLNPSDHPSHYQYLLCLERNGKLEDLKNEQARLQTIENDIQLIQQLSTVRMQQTPHDPELHYQAGIISQRAGSAQEALRWFQSALREDPNHAPTHKALAEYYDSIGDYGRAREHRQKAGAGGSVVSKTEDGKKPGTMPRRANP